MSGSLWYLLGIVTLAPVAGLVWWKLNDEWKAILWLRGNFIVACVVAYFLYVGAPALIWILPATTGNQSIALGILLGLGLIPTCVKADAYMEERWKRTQKPPR